MKYATWLGWQIESNWTKPWLFISYSIVKPISATLILVLMYLVIFSSSLTRPDIFAFMFIGNAFYMYVAQVLFGIVMVIHEEREHYQNLKQIYIAPISFYIYVMGRAVPKIIITSIAILITLAFGILVLGLDINLADVNWVMLGLAMIVGLMCICMIGIALAGVSFLTAKHSMGINEGIAGMFYLFCGVVFLITVLPLWRQAIGLGIPITYWLEIMRRAILTGSGLENIGGLQSYNEVEIFLFLLLSSVIFFFISRVIFRYADRLARKKGKLDITTSY